jgi:DNA repair protein RadC
MKDHIGHRERAMEKLLNAKFGTLLDYELLEILLFMAIPRQDTKQIAKSLISKYGSFAKVINSDFESLSEIEGLKTKTNIFTTFKLIKECSSRLIKAEIRNKPVISSWQRLLDYCRNLIGHLKKEAFVVLYLNNQNELIAEDFHDYGTVDQVSVYPREIVKRSVFLNASAVILAHNHPGGNTKASKADVELTERVVKALSLLNIKVHDHIIIGDRDFYSFKSEGLL